MLVLRIRAEKAVYSVIEGEYLDVCIVVTRGTVIFSFSVSVYLTTPCKAPVYCILILTNYSGTMSYYY